MRNIKCKKKAFTLAEVLITLGIIGVVAVLTIPSVMENYKNRLFATQLQKAYSQVVNAAETIMSDEHVDNFYETSATDEDDTTNYKSGPSYFLNKYFKHAKIDSGNNVKKFYGSSYESIMGDNAGSFGNTNTCIRTKAGATICTDYDYNNNGIFHVWIDVNGADEPNIAGRDAFILNITSDGSVEDFGSGSCDSCNEKTSSYGHIGDYSSGCFQCIVDKNWKMDY